MLACYQALVLFVSEVVHLHGISLHVLGVLLERYAPFVGFFSELKFFKNAKLLRGLRSPFAELVAVENTTLPDDTKLKEADKS